MSFNATTGVLSGTPAAADERGTYPITFTAHNGVGADATQSFTLTVNQAPAITSANSTTFTVGTAGTFTVTATGTPTPTLSQTGTLPAGVSFNTTSGVLSGTPAAATGGTYPITFTAQNGVAADATQNFTLTVNQAPATSSANSTTFTVGTIGSFTVTATGTPTPTLSQTGTLPAGVSFNATSGVLSGTPAAATGGTYPITFTAQNGVPANATQSFTLTVNQAPATSSASSTTFTVEVAGTFTVTATGTPTPTLSQTGTLPAGVSFNATTGVLSGTPAAGTGGTYPITFTAQNGVATDATQSFTLTVNQAPAITSANSTTFTVGTAGSFTVTATGTPTPTLSQTGTLPAGVSFNTTTGVLSGTPAAGTGGTYPITFTAQNGVAADATQSFTLTVNQAPAITSANSTTFTVGTIGSFTVTATGTPTPTLSQTETLPAGVSFNTTTGVLSGTPAAGTGGTYPITFTAQNGVAADATQSFTLTVNQAPATTSASSTTFTVGTNGSFTVTATGNPTPTLSQTGTLPAGVSFNATTGVLSGTPAAETGGTYPITFTAQNGVAADATQSFTLTVNQAPAISSANSVTFSIGTPGFFTVTGTGSPAPTLSETGTLPAGITFDPPSGVLSGTPAVGTAGTFPITFSASNGVGADALQNFTLTVNSLPVITTQPSSQAVTVGQTTTFMVAVTGSAPLTYQWQRNGVNISGTNSSTYTTVATTGADDGAQYTVSISNSLGSTFSIAATLTVNSPPSITAQPASQTMGTGETAIFNVSVSVTGALPLSYQWLKNNVSIPGATGPSYTTPVTTQSDSGAQFSVIVANSLGSPVSNAATLTVVQIPSPATFFVDFASGSDSNSGLSKDAAWQYAPGMDNCTANCALIQLHSGDRVIFKGGVAWDASGFPMVVSASGASGNPIYYGVDPTWFAGSAWSRPVFDLSASTWSVAPILADSANFVTFDNLEIRNETIDYALWPPRSGIAVNGGSNITIQNCYIHGWSAQNAVDYYPSGGIAFYNDSIGGVVKNSVLDGSPASNAGVGIYGGASIQQNVIENLPNGIVITDPAASVSGNQVFNIFRSADPSINSIGILAYTSGSIFDDIVHDVAPGASAIYLKSGAFLAGNTQYVYNNLAWNVGDHSPITISSDAIAPSTQFIYNNTLLGGVSTGCITVEPNNFPPANLTVQNNHCISDVPSSRAWCWNNAGGDFNCGPVTNLVFNNNVLMPTTTATSQGYTLANSFQSAVPTGATIGAGLNLISSCVTIGATLCSDRLGVVRPGGSAAWDAGAYQYQSSVDGIAPIITLEPVRQAVTMGHTATFSVIAAGTAPLNYQWQKNGVPISGATSSTYTSPATKTSDDGASFGVMVSNAVGTVTSSPAVLTVNAAAGQLVSDPTSVNFGTLNIGTTSTASVTLTNGSSSYVTVSNVSVSGSGFSVSGVPSGFIMAPGQTATMNVMFAPASTGNVGGSVTISSDATGSPTTIPFSGTGVVPPHTVYLGWDPSISPVFGYYVYRATSQFGPYARLNSTPSTITQYIDVTVQPGQTYIYWVTAVDSDTVESQFSDSVSAIIPTP